MRNSTSHLRGIAVMLSVASLGRVGPALAFALAISVTVPAPAAAQATHVVTDMTGATISVPVEVNRIAILYPAHTVTDIMLGVGDKIVVIPQNVKTIPLLQKIYPRILDVSEIVRSGSTVNMEEIVSLQPDVAVVGGATASEQFTNAGIPPVMMYFDNYAELPRSITLAGEVYGGVAVERAAAFNAYFADKYEMVKARTAALRPDERPRVVHISSFPPLVIDGNSTLIQEWIELGGGTAAAVGIDGLAKGITFEQLLEWDPDVIVVQTPGGDQGLKANSGQSVIDELAKSPGWSDLAAVRNSRVVINPQGMYPWERFGPEQALQIQWIAKTLHPELFKDLDIRAEARSFYRTFFNYDLSEAELDQMLQVQR